MTKLILKSPYIQSGKSAGGYMKYIATRENVEILPDNRPATQKQEQLIRSIVKDFPHTKELFEYGDWSAARTKAHAFAFITTALELNWNAMRRSDGYMKYIATRPRAEKLGEHGLFGDSDAVDLEKAMQEIAQYEGRVWTHIISLRREDAARLGYHNANSWRNLLKAHRNDIAAAMQISPENFRWYAAFHNEGEHPHVHMMAWSACPMQGYLTRDGIAAIRSRLTNDIFHDEMLHLYEQKTVAREELVQETRQAMVRLVKKMETELCDSPQVENLISELAGQMNFVSGKKQYGYLPKKVKHTVDQIVDGLEQQSAVAECYRRWRDLQGQVQGYYTGAQPEALPLSLSDDADVRDIPAGLRWLERAAASGSSWAGYRLGKEYLKGNLVSKNIPAAMEYLSRTAEQGNQFAQYALGKLYLTGRDIPQDRELAGQWLALAAAQNNSYAQFFLDRIDSNREPSVMLAATRLLGQIGQIFRDHSIPPANPDGIRIDSKRREMVREKRLAMGQRDEPEQGMHFSY